MSNAQEYGTCDICGNKHPLNRKYYRYPIKCECCNGPEDDHFEICFHCDDCAPRPPRMVKCFLQPIKDVPKKRKGNPGDTTQGSV